MIDAPSPAQRRRLTPPGRAALWPVRVALVVQALLATHAPSLTVAQDAAPPDATAGLTVVKIQERLKRVEESPELDKDLKANLIDVYKKAIDQLKVAGEWDAKIKSLQERRVDDREELEKLKTRLDAPAVESVVNAPSDATVAQLEQALVAAEAELKAAQQRLTDSQGEGKRRGELPDLLTKAQGRLKELDQEVSTLPAAGDVLDPSEARRVFVTAMRRAAQSELTAYENDRVWYEANTELVALRQDAATLDVKQAEGVTRRCRDLLNEKRQQEALKQAEQARRTAVAAMPELKALADKNADLAQQRNGPQGFLARNTALAKEDDELKKELADLKAKFDRAQTRIDAAGMTDAVGLLLQKQQADLPDLRAHRQRLHARQAEASQVRAKLIELDDQLAELADLDKQVRKVMDSIAPHLSGYQRDEIETALRELLKARREYLTSQASDGYAYIENLEIDVNSHEKDLIEAIEKYKDFISERILWVRSNPALAVTDFHRAWEGAVKLADAGRCRTALRDLARDARENAGLYLVAALVVIPLAVAQRRLRRRVQTVDQHCAQAYAADIRPTIEVVLLTALISILWPLATALVAWRLTAPAAASLHAQNVAYGLRVTAVAFLSLETLRQICRHKGLAEAHFGWPAHGLALVARHLRWAMPLGLPLCFLVAVAESPEFDLHRSPLGRLAFIAGMFVLAVLAHGVLHPTRGLLLSVAERPDVSWFWKKPRLWHLMTVASPVAMAIVAATGYFYTALELAWRLHAMMWVLVGLLVSQALAQRCLLVARRKLAIKQARERRAMAMAHAQHHGQVTAEVGPSTSENPVDLVTIDLQTRRLLRSFINVALLIGCWLIWVDVLPALGILDRCHLWSYNAVVHELNSLGETVAIKSVPRWITLADALLSGTIVLLTIVASRNLPGLLEIAFLQRLPLDPGGRYAITTVSRYVITLVGLSIAFWMIGVGWSNVQWLVAAMTVGLGFGLQEIFANFISGLIILFERPMRVGDVVTIGGISGSVSRIRIRATTITDGDRKELIVPNKEFITGQLINWTLSDTVLRMVIRIGVAYGSDIGLVRQLLLQAAHEDARVLHDPPATAVLDQFGDSTLNFELRLFVGGLDAFPDIRHDLSARIDHLFREAGIEMAFPQRDIHVRSIDAALGMLPRVSDQLKRAG